MNSQRAKDIVRAYVADKLIEPCDFEVYIVWQCKALQNWKFLLSTDIKDGMYYELTYNGDKAEAYLDAYKKVENICFR